MSEPITPFNAADWRPPSFIESSMLRWTLGLMMAVYLSIAVGSLDVNWSRLAEGMQRGGWFLAAFTSPDFTSQSRDILLGLEESLTMTLAATVIGVLLSIPVALGAAGNISPAPVYLLCRAFIGISRSFQEIILAIFFVAMFGFGPFAGLVTLSVATIGFFAKLLAEDIEAMDPVQAEAIKSTGAGWLQWINYGIQPQVMPRIIGLSLYRLDINFRESAVIGIVGGGGIGATLNTAFDRYEFETAAAILLIIIAIVMIAEYTSSIVREKVQ
ncbi:MAG: phosphonate ABC transporter, permease protein PhnE [Pseudomonadales bacterium]|jgi:phosphonate transport system permease protein|nr:phosphonate ABC transporter, permease protein PhnE [Gammaproteobacteria bacterium]MDP6025371.1 phosphonate ABC transporter, permease protein PhnE [Pseudomonadales bacterium]MDP7316398.1 phosphonate ABC transporter, permease protein PhnE [Pseudomonadales bacterium]MDP7576878.1 phosphonate ABC transporter, permease protein PhnE [Pseudomonadales bacterium]HJP51358.1 phosphonate ABC transporter, permease protein PhnE [Pseudomonadales bacterium]|tara:strand:+ start:2902 stop:3714 length:813 start_codon:yes stop_codon:yes gene_type:complete